MFPGIGCQENVLLSENFLYRRSYIVAPTLWKALLDLLLYGYCANQRYNLHCQNRSRIEPAGGDVILHDISSDRSHSARVEHSKGSGEAIVSRGEIGFCLVFQPSSLHNLESFTNPHWFAMNSSGLDLHGFFNHGSIWQSLKDFSHWGACVLQRKTSTKMLLEEPIRTLCP